MKNRKLIVVLLCLSLIITCFTGCGGTEEPAAAVTVLTNGVIYTVDGEDWAGSPADTLVYDDTGAILFVGAAADAEEYMGDTSTVIDLEGKTVMPGFIDTHCHAPGSAITELYDIYLYESITKEQTLADIASFIEEHPDLEAYWGTGYTVGIGGDPKGPKGEWLDEICSDKPIILTSNDGHNMWMNSKAFEMNGITKDTPVPAGGALPKDPATGELWGTLTDASSLVSMEPVYTPEQQAEALAYWQDTMHSWGYTSVMCIYPHSVSTDTYLDLENSGELTMRFDIAGGAEPDADFEEQLAAAIEMRDAFADSELMKVTTMKYFADGVVEGMTGFLHEPYAPEAGMPEGYVSEFYWDQEALKGYFARTMEEGFQIHVHSIGDAATDNIVAAMEYAQEQNPDADARNVITHLQLVTEDAKAKMGELGIIGSTQPFWHFKEPEWFEYVDAVALGQDRAWTEYPVKSLIDNGVMVTFSGDHPVSPIDSPLWAMEVAITRNLENADYYGVDDITDIDDPTWLLNPDERISPAQAVEAYTVNSAYQLYREDEVGTISVGKKADLVVLGDDMLNCNPIDIDGIEICATIFNGAVVYGEL